MADIRIKDLTTTASSTASDDFIAVDGATNGTRKLNAYSPSFGGNATVAGKVAINGGDTSASQLAVTAPSNTLAANFASSTTSGQSFGIRLFAGTNSSDYAVKIRNAGDTLSLLDIDGAGKVSLGATTASTSTSTGALVVSGGVGVAGKIYAGSNISTAATLESTAGAVESVATDSYFNLRAGATLQGYVRAYSPSAEIYFYNARSGPLILGTNNTTALTITSAQQVQVNATTASTSTSTGALVVSGGVGVAGAIYAGGNLGLANSSNILFGTDTSFYRSSAGSLNVDHVGGSLPVVYLRANGSATAAWFTDGGVCYFGSSTANGLVLRTNNTTALTISASQNATFAGNISTAAPAGGTAAAWKLGTVASVSPTSPNRTIEVDIGGTIYYIHAKTTNN